MPTYNYNNSANVCYNSGCYTVFRLRDVNGAAGYLLRKVDDGTVVDNVLESDCTDCTCTTIINLFWSDFVYTGNNGAASLWVMNNLIKNMCQCSNVSYGPNGDSTVYTFSCSDGSWTKQKSN